MHGVLQFVHYYIMIYDSMRTRLNSAWSRSYKAKQLAKLYQDTQTCQANTTVGINLGNSNQITNTLPINVSLDKHIRLQGAAQVNFEPQQP